jgi:hypothetical protein
MDANVAERWQSEEHRDESRSECEIETGGQIQRRLKIKWKEKIRRRTERWEK